MYIVWEERYNSNLSFFSINEFTKLELRGKLIEAITVEGPKIISTSQFRDEKEASRVFNEIVRRVCKLESLDGDSVEMDYVFNVVEFLEDFSDE